MNGIANIVDSIRCAASLEHVRTERDALMIMVGYLKAGNPEVSHELVVLLETIRQRQGGAA